MSSDVLGYGLRSGHPTPGPRIAKNDRVFGKRPLSGRTPADENASPRRVAEVSESVGTEDPVPSNGAVGQGRKACRIGHVPVDGATGRLTAHGASTFSACCGVRRNGTIGSRKCEPLPVKSWAGDRTTDCRTAGSNALPAQ